MSLLEGLDRLGAISSLPNSSVEFSEYTDTAEPSFIPSQSVRENSLFSPNITMHLTVENTAEGSEYIVATLTLSQAPQNSGTLTLTTSEGVTVTIPIIVGQSEYTHIYIPHSNAEDVYLDASELTVTATLSAEVYGQSIAPVTATAQIADTIDTTTADLSTSDVSESDGGY
jgi:hypothetical protein